MVCAGAKVRLQRRRTLRAFAAFRAAGAHSTMAACLNQANPPIARQVNSRGGIVVSKCSASVRN